jgi:hypothetical protein
MKLLDKLTVLVSLIRNMHLGSSNSVNDTLCGTNSTERQMKNERSVTIGQMETL